MTLGGKPPKSQLPVHAPGSGHGESTSTPAAEQEGGASVVEVQGRHERMSFETRS